MAHETLLELIEFLGKTSAEVKRIEAEAEVVVETEGQVAFQIKMEEKAEILAALGEKAWKLTDKIEGSLGDEITQKLEQFSMSASTALRIGSVFFMSALLYPEDHVQGEPNDLEAFIEELKKKN
ncbi:hypothetical protein [Pseudodesulfovibrio sediminis]|uniref:Uncharacterized protein n=1 Tax=Pseudodesulfovibrio sediminis TaxID=2810563 RepID=A0ABN6EQA3_9BACT|nr:hypothetical protein [Pseudodesulfovibrio sediminis]BCS87483.1 hypothetical protein PSDVSF_07250 [Pseudodesulfovibrio sediminis]